MQNGKEMRRGRVGLMHIAGALACAAMLGVAGPTEAVLVVHPGSDPGLRVATPRWLDVPVYSDADDRIAGASFSCCNPYMIEDLVACAVLAGLRTRGAEAWASWFHIDHPFYREDQLTISLGARLPSRFRSFWLRVNPGAERREVEGCAARLARAFSLSLACECGGSLTIEAECQPFGERPGAPRSASVSAVVRAGAAWVSVHRVVSGEGPKETMVRCAAAIHGRAAIVSAYRASTEELMCGLAVRTGPLLLDLTWSYHPTLGRSISAGIGRWWAW